MVSVQGGELVDLPEIDYGGERSAANRFLVRHAVARADRVLVGSEQQRRLAAFRVGPERLLVCPLGVDTRLFRPGPVAPRSVELDGDPRLLCVGSLLAVKDHTTLEWDAEKGEVLYHARSRRASSPYGSVARWDVLDFIARLTQHIPATAPSSFCVTGASTRTQRVASAAVLSRPGGPRLASNSYSWLQTLSPSAHSTS